MIATVGNYGVPRPLSGQPVPPETGARPQRALDEGRPARQPALPVNVAVDRP